MLLAELRDRRARGVPSPRCPARHARPARGVPASRRRPVRARLRARRDPEPLHHVQRELPLRRAARLRRARGRRAARHRPLRTDRRARRPPAARARRGSHEGPVLHARAARPALPRPALVPARRADEGGDARRGRVGRAGRRAPGREPGGVLPRRRRLPDVSHEARARGRGGPDRGRGRPHARRARRLLALHARPAPRDRRLGPGTALRAPHRGGDEHARDRAARLARDDHRHRARPALRGRPGRLRQAPLPLAGAAARVQQAEGGFRLDLGEPAYGVAPGQAAVLYDGDVVVGCGVVSSVGDT